MNATKYPPLWCQVKLLIIFSQKPGEVATQKENRELTKVRVFLRIFEETNNTKVVPNQHWQQYLAGANCNDEYVLAFVIYRRLIRYYYSVSVSDTRLLYLRYLSWCYSKNRPACKHPSYTSIRENRRPPRRDRKRKDNPRKLDRTGYKRLIMALAEISQAKIKSGQIDQLLQHLAIEVSNQSCTGQHCPWWLGLATSRVAEVWRRLRCCGL